MGEKIVLDTNVLVSAFGWKGSPHKVFFECIEGNHQLYISPSIINELIRVLSYPKFKFSKKNIDKFISIIIEIAVIVNPLLSLNIIKDDPSDNRILECAVESNCDFILSGDKHFLDIVNIFDIRIISPDYFLCLFKPSSAIA